MANLALPRWPKNREIEPDHKQFIKMPWHAKWQTEKIKKKWKENINLHGLQVLLTQIVAEKPYV